MTVIPFDNLDGWTSLYDTPTADGALHAPPGAYGLFWIVRTDDRAISGTISVVADLNDPGTLFLVGFSSDLALYWGPSSYGMLVMGGSVFDQIAVSDYVGQLVLALDVTGTTYTATATPLGSSTPLYSLSGTVDGAMLASWTDAAPTPTLAGYDSTANTYDDFTFTKPATYHEGVDYDPVVLDVPATRVFSRPVQLIEDYGGVPYDFRDSAPEPTIVPHGPGVNEFDPGYDSPVPVHALIESGGTEFPGGEQFQAFTDVPAIEGTRCQIEVRWSETHRETLQASDYDWTIPYPTDTDPMTVPVVTIDDLVITQDPDEFIGAAYTPEAVIRFKPVGGTERSVSAAGGWAPGAISYTNRQRALHSSSAVQYGRIGEPSFYNSYQHEREWIPAASDDPDIWHYPTISPSTWRVYDTVGSDTISFTRRYLLRPGESGSGSTIYFEEIPERLGLVRQFLTKLGAAAVTGVQFTIRSSTPGYWADEEAPPPPPPPGPVVNIVRVHAGAVRG